MEIIKPYPGTGFMLKSNNLFNSLILYRMRLFFVTL